MNTATSSFPSPVYVVVTKTGDKGTINAHEIYEGYTVEGWMYKLPVVGNNFCILRVKRNGVERVGTFKTGLVEAVLTKISQSVFDCTFETANSYYRIDVDPKIEYDDSVVLEAVVNELKDLTNKKLN